MTFRRILILFLLGLSFSALQASPDQLSEACKSCVYAQTENVSNNNTAIYKNVIILLVIALATGYAWFTYKKKLYLAVGIIGLAVVAGSFMYSALHKPAKVAPIACKLAESKTDTFKNASTDEFSPAGTEFANTSSTDRTTKPDSLKTSSSDEFAPVSADLTNTSTQTSPPSFDYALLWQILILFGLIVIISYTIKYRFIQNLRGLVLLSSIAYLGFYKGACPCMIMSLQSTVLYILGNQVSWLAMLWFVGLIPLTYFFGKIWCGWLCHLGGLQEFLFRASGWHWLTLPKTQEILKYIQLGTFTGLMVQLFITQTNIWVHYDPFKVAFNLVSANTVGYVLLVIMLISSVLIYRPFCRIFCPVGLVLGWISKLPGARKIQVSANNCNNCRTCTRHCKQHAIHSQAKTIEICNDDCIVCGECLDHCKKNALRVSNKISQ